MSGPNRGFAAISSPELFTLADKTNKNKGRNIKSEEPSQLLNLLNSNELPKPNISELPSFEVPVIRNKRAALLMSSPIFAGGPIIGAQKLVPTTPPITPKHEKSANKTRKENISRSDCQIEVDIILQEPKKVRNSDTNLSMMEPINQDSVIVVRKETIGKPALPNEIDIQENFGDMCSPLRVRQNVLFTPFSSNPVKTTVIQIFYATNCQFH